MLNDAVKQQLWGLWLSSPASTGDKVTGEEVMADQCLFSARQHEGRPLGLVAPDPAPCVADESGTSIGTVTSVTEGFALGYVRSRSRGEQVQLEGKQVCAMFCCTCCIPLPCNSLHADTCSSVGVHAYPQVLINGRPAKVVDIPMATREIHEAPLLAVKP